MPYRLALYALLFVLVLATPLAHGQATYRFDLPEQPLADSLRAIATQTGTNVLFEAKDVKGIKAAELHAELTTHDAIKRVLGDTRLEIESTTPGSVIIRPIEGVFRRHPYALNPVIELEGEVLSAL
jgi:hypothetical protein